MPTKLLDRITAQSVTVDTVYLLRAGQTYLFTLNGTGVWEFNESGVAVVGSDTGWSAFLAGASKNFEAAVPSTGEVRCNVGSGTCILNAIPKNPD
jgi:hypothetical protein